MTSTQGRTETNVFDEGLVELAGSGFYAVPDVDKLAPFLMSVVSDGDRWMFISSTGGLTAGRIDSSRALFPYETDDRLHHGAGRVGPVTCVRGPSGSIWTPFGGTPQSGGHRTLFKSVVGDAIVFEESHAELALTFRYRWSSCDRFGFVRTATVVNQGARPVQFDMLDGILGVLPFGLAPSVYQGMSNLTNAYKRSELVDPGGRLAAFSLETQIVDRPEPAEVLRCSVVWSTGFEDAEVTLSPDAPIRFERGLSNTPLGLVTGRPGAYLLSGSIELGPGEERSWHIVADVACDQKAVSELRALVRSESDLPAEIQASLAEATNSLVDIMAPADAMQRTGDRVATAHQFANVTYNVMRGGIPLSGYHLATSDLLAFLEDRNRTVAARHRSWIEALQPTIDRDGLLAQIAEIGDPQLVRLGLEYLPFSFSRRHGDPSRPWNRFSIRVRDDAGRPIVYYEGNWRDIFQNWEALCMSFPEYLPGVVSVFVNASTADGFNPYRITRHGIDWEVPDPEDPWSNIGYWGDHQIVYLLRLLESADRYLPGSIEEMLDQRYFSYADVPYRLAPYEELVQSPKQTIAFDEAADSLAAERVAEVGGDGRLLWDDSDRVHLATLAEKLVVPALAKLSNFVPGGGIWMNTQRPEWNDANNALAGFGLSMVTLYHLRRYLDHLRRMLNRTGLESVATSAAIAEWLHELRSVLDDFAGREAESSDTARRAMVDRLGTAFTRYRAHLYASGLGDATGVAVEHITALCDVAVEHLDATIRRARRQDGLYHSYNIIRFGADAASVDHLHEMLEGQVAVLESGVLTPAERADVIEALFSSAIYRPDQRSFMLYPANPPRAFLERNVIPAAAVAANPLLSALIDSGERSVIVVDADGRYRFSPELTSEDHLIAALDRLVASPRWTEVASANYGITLGTYESVFGHRAYTGRSGSMYGYEGIGSIYWHMVAKLLVAVQESVLDADSKGASPETLGRLIDAYWRVRSGLGFNKTASEFGAIPIDPYSHSPAHAGAQQPGMTGLVKEELLTRLLEVGVRIENGEIHFDPILLRPEELLGQPERWSVHDLDLQPVEVALPAGSLGLTLCQVPVVVSTLHGERSIEVHWTDGSIDRHAGSRLDRHTSAEVFARTGEIVRIDAHVAGDVA
jgi:hypothetical protein